MTKVVTIQDPWREQLEAASNGYKVEIPECPSDLACDLKYKLLVQPLSLKDKLSDLIQYFKPIIKKVKCFFGFHSNWVVREIVRSYFNPTQFRYRCTSCGKEIKNGSRKEK